MEVPKGSTETTYNSQPALTHEHRVQRRILTGIKVFQMIKVSLSKSKLLCPVLDYIEFKVIKICQNVKALILCNWTYSALSYKALSERATVRENIVNRPKIWELLILRSVISLYVVGLIPRSQRYWLFIPRLPGYWEMK